MLLKKPARTPSNQSVIDDEYSDYDYSNPSSAPTSICKPKRITKKLIITFSFGILVVLTTSVSVAIILNNSSNPGSSSTSSPSKSPLTSAMPSLKSSLAPSFEPSLKNSILPTSTPTASPTVQPSFTNSLFPTEGKLGLLGNLLGPGDQRTSPNGNVSLKYHTDGNLVLYNGSNMIWGTNTRGLSSNVVSMQDDGNLVVYSQSRAVFASHTEGHDGAKLYIQDDGKLVIRDTTGNQIWQNGPWDDDEGLRGDDLLWPDEERTSPNGNVSLKYQTDGNLVLYNGPTVLWATNTKGTSPRLVSLHDDGNFVVYSESTVVFASNTNRHSGAKLYIQDDRKLVIKDATGNQIWSAL